MTGWVFILSGVVLIALGSLSIYYGQDLLGRPRPEAAVNLPTLSPRQERLLSLIHKYQVQFAASKLIINRSGELYFDEPERKDLRINLLSELFGIKESDQAKRTAFQDLIEQIPPAYLRHIPEARLDSPFVVTITEAGIEYLRRKH